MVPCRDFAYLLPKVQESFELFGKDTFKKKIGYLSNMIALNLAIY